MTHRTGYVSDYTGQRIIMIVVAILSLGAILFLWPVNIHFLSLLFGDRGYATVIEWLVLAGIPLGFTTNLVLSILAVFKKYRWAGWLLTALLILVVLWFGTIGVWAFT